MTADADDLRAMARSWAWVEEDRDRRTRPKYVPTGGFTNATRRTEYNARMQAEGAFAPWTERERQIMRYPLAYGMAPARTPIYANRPWEDALLPPLDEMSLLDE